MFVVLLGYFKAKPVVLNPGFHQIKHDLKHVYQSVLMGFGFRPFKLSLKENERVYQEIFNLCEYQRWSIKSHRTSLVDSLTEQTKAWSAPRNLFDAAIEYFSGHKIAIPAYSTLQKIISHVINEQQTRLIAHIKRELSRDLTQALTDLAAGDGALTLRQLRQSARNFTGTELEKELAIHRYIQDWQKAAKNVSNAAEVLHLFIDDTIDQHQPFGTVKQKVLKLLAATDLESVCLFLNEQKRSVDDAMWLYYDQRKSLREGLLRQLFLCLYFEGSENTQRLTAALGHARLDLVAQGGISHTTIDGQLPAKKQRP